MIFFIWSSIQYDDLKDHFDDLLELYHKHFYKTLEELGCDTTPFGFSNFLEVIENDAPYEFIHLLYMTVPIHGRRGEASVDMNKEDWSSMITEDATTIEAKEKIAKIVYEFGKRGWIKKVKKLVDDDEIILL